MFQCCFVVHFCPHCIRSELFFSGTAYYRVAQKSKPLPDDQKIALNRMIPVDEIRFIRQIKVWIKHYNIIRWC